MKKLARDPDHINLMNSAKCFVCQEPGHFAKNCPEKFNRKKNETKFEKNSNPRDEKDNGKPLVMMQDNRKRYQNRKEKSERNRKKTENGDLDREKDSKDTNESYLNYKNKTNRGYNRRHKRDNSDKEREHFEKLTQNFIRGGKP